MVATLKICRPYQPSKITDSPPNSTGPTKEVGTPHTHVSCQLVFDPASQKPGTGVNPTFDLATTGHGGREEEESATTSTATKASGKDAPPTLEPVTSRNTQLAPTKKTPVLSWSVSTLHDGTTCRIPRRDNENKHHGAGDTDGTGGSDDPLKFNTDGIIVQIKWRIGETSMVHGNRAMRLNVTYAPYPRNNHNGHHELTVLSPAFTAVRLMLQIRRQPAAVFYKWQGGKRNVLQCDVDLVDRDGGRVRP